MRKPYWSAAIATEEWLTARNNFYNHKFSNCPNCCAKMQCSESAELERIYNEACTYEVNINIKQAG